MNIGIVIPTLHRYESLMGLILAMNEQSIIPAHIYIVTAGRVDKTFEMLKQFRKTLKSDIQVISSGYRNLPFQRYLGYLSCNDDIIVYLDDDLVIHDSSFLAELVRPLDGNEYVASTCRIVFRKTGTGEKQGIVSQWHKESNSPVNIFFDMLLGYGRLKAGECGPAGIKIYPDNMKPLSEIAFLSGGCMAIKRDILEDAFFSDDLFAMYHSGLGKGEDFYLSRQISQKGKMSFVCTTEAEHPENDIPQAYRNSPVQLGKAVAYSRLFLSKTWRGSGKSSSRDIIFYWYYAFMRFAGGVLKQIVLPDRMRFFYLIGWLRGMWLSLVLPQDSACLCPEIQWREEAVESIRQTKRLEDYDARHVVPAIRKDRAITVSVCIPTYSRPESVRNVLGSISLQRDPPDEIVIVDASENRETESVVKNMSGAIPITYHRTSKGLTTQKNTAVELSTGEIIIFLDDDIELDDKFVEVVRKVFLNDKLKSIAGISGVITNEGQARYGMGWKLKKKLGIIESSGEGRLLSSGETTALPRKEFDGLLPVDFLHGGLTAWRKSVFSDFRFSQFFSGYGLGEDKYFSSCVGRIHQLYSCGQAKAIHLHKEGNRPGHFSRGLYNVYNHYFIMTECVRNPHKKIKFYLFHIIDACNDLLSWPFRSEKKKRLLYGIGRISGLVKCVLQPPRMAPDDPAQINRKSLKNSSSL